MDHSQTDIVIERVEDWIEIKLDRPEKHNALRESTAHQIMTALDAAEEDRAIRAVILQGNSKTFCTGIDTSEFSIGDGEYFDFYRRRRRLRLVNRLFRELPQFSKPVITVVEGYALGGGLELALVGDLIVAGANAKFGLPEVRLGMMPGGGGTQTLTRLLGRPLAKELIWTGRRLGAEEALKHGLVSHLAPAGEALERARVMVREIAASAPLSVMASKAAIDRGADLSLAEGMAAEGDLSFLLYFSGDRAEGLSAFREKRTPTFKGQ